MSSENDKSKIVKLMITVIILIVIALVGTYALTIWRSTENTELTLRIGDISGFYCTKGDNIEINNIGPIFDYTIDGESTTFSIDNQTNETANVTVKFHITTITDNLKEESFKYVLMTNTNNSSYTVYKEGDFKDVTSNSSITLLDNYEVGLSSRVSFKLVIYIDGNMENPITMQGGSLLGYLDACREENPNGNLDNSGANRPVLVDGLIPIVYDESTSTWVKADTTSSTSTYGWYDYDQKKWANAVLVKNTENLTKITDISNNGNDGKIYGATQTINGITLSNSTSQYVNFPNNIDLTFPVTYSVTFSTSSTSDQIIFGDYKTKAGLGMINSGAQLVVNLNSENATYTINTGGISLNTFYTIDLVYNSISNMDVYLNGTKLLKTASTNYWTWTDTNSYIGKRANGVNCFNGTIKRFMIYNDALTESEINYNLTADKSKVCNNGIICDKLKLYYNFEDSTSIRTLSLKENYLEAQTGTQISTDDILAFYVWIPRYKYKVWNINKNVTGGKANQSYDAQTLGIDVVFEEDSSSTGTISCTYNYNVVANSGGINLSNEPAEKCVGSDGDYYTHPVFSFGDTEVKGFWMGKFELSYYSGIAKILPNNSPESNRKLSVFHNDIRVMQSNNNSYGLETTKTVADSHMITNMEWGAVAYLTHSKYGRCTNNTCEKLTVNETLKTGFGGSSTDNVNNYYNGSIGVLASTTGNVYGVYDMAGGSYEYVMGVVSASSTDYDVDPDYEDAIGSYFYPSGHSQYLTAYAYGSSTNDVKAYHRGRLGDATSEVVGFDTPSVFPSDGGYTWFARSGLIAGNIFSFDRTKGDGSSNYTSRAVLTPLT